MCLFNALKGLFNAFLSFVLAHILVLMFATLVDLAPDPGIQQIFFRDQHVLSGHAHIHNWAKVTQKGIVLPSLWGT